MKDTPPGEESKGTPPTAPRPALTQAKRLFADIILSLAKSGAIPPDKAAEGIAYLKKRRDRGEAP